MAPGEPKKESLFLPECRIGEIVPAFESIPVSLIDYQHSYGDLPLGELMMLCRIVRYRKPSIVFEIGTYRGGTTLQLGANSRAEVYTLDLPRGGRPNHAVPIMQDPESDVYPDQPGERFHKTPYADRIQQLFGDSLTYDFTPFYGEVDLVFVDGCHHYKFVLSDSHNALRMMSPEGIVVWHDYAPYAPGVVKVLNDLGKTIPLKHVAGTSLVIHQQASKRL